MIIKATYKGDRVHWLWRILLIPQSRNVHAPNTPRMNMLHVFDVCSPSDHLQPSTHLPENVLINDKNVLYKFIKTHDKMYKKSMETLYESPEMKIKVKVQ